MAHEPKFAVEAFFFWGIPLIYATCMLQIAEQALIPVPGLWKISSKFWCGCLIFLIGFWWEGLETSWVAVQRGWIWVKPTVVFGFYQVEFTESIWGQSLLIGYPTLTLAMVKYHHSQASTQAQQVWQSNLKHRSSTHHMVVLLSPLRLYSMPKWLFSSSHIITQFSQVRCGPLSCLVAIPDTSKTN